MPDPPAADADAYFVRDGEHTYLPTRHTGGAWSATEQHVSPLNGLVVHAVDRFVTERAERTGVTDGRAVSRLGVDVLGPVALVPCEVDVRVVRPGRTIELLEATVVAGGRAVLLARAWRLAGADTTAVEGGGPARVPGPDALPSWPMTSVWPGGYIASLDVRRSADSVPGRTTAWVSTPLPLVADEPVSPLASYVALVDTANGICVRQSPERWMFPNVDLTVHLHRQPVAGPVGLDTTVVFGPAGHGLTSTVLHDARRPGGARRADPDPAPPLSRARSRARASPPAAGAAAPQQRSAPGACPVSRYVSTAPTTHAGPPAR